MNFLKDSAYFLACGIAVSIGSSANAQPFDTQAPPKDIRSLLVKLKLVEGQTSAIAALSVRDIAAPFLRSELGTATDKNYKRNLTEALGAIESRAYERNKKRFAWWAKTRRFDLCAELLVDCPSNKDAVELTDHALASLYEVSAEIAQALDISFGPDAIGIKLPIPFAKCRKVIHLADAELSVPGGYFSTGQTLLRADFLKLSVSDTHGFFAAVRSGVQYEGGAAGIWLNSVALVNDSMLVRSANSAVIVCDGDVELDVGPMVHCVIIANGDIRAAKGKRFGGGLNSAWCASGNIELSSLGGIDKGSRFFALGAVTISGKATTSDHVKEKQKALPFGVRFVSPADFGLDLAVQNGGVQVMGIAADSPFAKYGVNDGDVITAIDDTTADSLPVFRRHLRRGILRESVVLTIRRGNERLTRIVFLDGIPLPTAPAPRAK